MEEKEEKENENEEKDKKKQREKEKRGKEGRKERIYVIKQCMTIKKDDPKPRAEKR